MTTSWCVVFVDPKTRKSVKAVYGYTDGYTSYLGHLLAKELVTLCRVLAATKNDVPTIRKAKNWFVKTLAVKDIEHDLLASTNFKGIEYDGTTIDAFTRAMPTLTDYRYMVTMPTADEFKIDWFACGCRGSGSPTELLQFFSEPESSTYELQQLTVVCQREGKPDSTLHLCGNKPFTLYQLFENFDWSSFDADKLNYIPLIKRVMKKLGLKAVKQVENSTTLTFLSDGFLSFMGPGVFVKLDDLEELIGSIDY